MPELREGKCQPRQECWTENVWKEDACGWVEICKRMNRKFAMEWEREGKKDRIRRSIEIKGGKGQRRHARVCESVRGQSRRNSVCVRICEGRDGGKQRYHTLGLRARSPMLRIHSITRHHCQGRFIRPPLWAAESRMPQPDMDKRVTLTPVFYGPSLKTMQLTS